jgi:hypothetical protein
MTKKDKSSVYRGVSYHIRHNKWHARISHAGTAYHLGYYEREDEAAMAYNRKAIELLGGSADLNDIGGGL